MPREQSAWLLRSGVQYAVDGFVGRREVGAPVLADTKIRVSDLVSLWRTAERVSTVAEEYDLSVDVVEDVLRQRSLSSSSTAVWGNHG